MMLRSLLLLLPAVFLIPTAAVSQGVSRYYAISFVIDKSANPKKPGICTDYRVVTNEERQLPAGSKFNEVRAQFREAFLAQHRSNTYEGATAEMVPWGRVLVAVSHNIDYLGYNCSRKQIRLFVADDVDTARRNLEGWKKDCGGRCSGWQEIAFWPGLPRITHEIGMPDWAGFEGVKITGTSGTTRTTGTKLTAFQVRNTRSDMAAVLVVLEDGRLVGDPIVVQPGQMAGGVLKGRQELRAHRLVTPTEAESPGWIILLKNAIRKWLGTEDVKPSPGSGSCPYCGAPGVRG
jgi:hypothetical protein